MPPCKEGRGKRSGFLFGLIKIVFTKRKCAKPVRRLERAFLRGVKEMGTRTTN